MRILTVVAIVVSLTFIECEGSEDKVWHCISDVDCSHLGEAWEDATLFHYNTVCRDMDELRATMEAHADCEVDNPEHTYYDCRCYNTRCWRVDRSKTTCD